jgi:hypothetical protein
MPVAEVLDYNALDAAVHYVLSVGVSVQDRYDKRKVSASKRLHVGVSG